MSQSYDHGVIADINSTFSNCPIKQNVTENCNINSYKPVVLGSSLWNVCI